MAIARPDNHPGTRASTGATSDAGFTLVEVLVVLAILGLAIGMVVINLPKAPPALKAEVELLAARMSAAQDAAIITGQPTGLEFSDSQYVFYEYDGQWLQRGVTGLPDAKKKLELDGSTLKLKPELNKPQIIFDPTGEVTDFALTLNTPRNGYIISLSDSGRVIWDGE